MPMLEVKSESVTSGLTLAESPSTSGSAPCKPEAWIQHCVANKTFLGGAATQDELVTRRNMRDVVVHDMEIIFKKYGGPMQFLEAALTSPEEIARFTQFLDGLHGSSETCDGKDFSAKGNIQFQGKISQLSFKAESSIKPPTFQNTALKLVDEYTLNGFLSKEQPIQVWLKDTCKTETQFQLFFVKGAARSHTLQALLMYIMYMKRNLRSLLLRSRAA